MDKKQLIRKKYFLKRKKHYYEINESFFNPLLKLIKRKKNKKYNISIYFPSSYEPNVQKILNIEFLKNIIFFFQELMKISCIFINGKKTNLYYWINMEYQNPKNQKNLPNLILVPLLAFDEKKNRLGYGKGFYDKYLNKLKKIRKKILVVGVAFSFQKHNNLPVNKTDFKLDYIITDKGIIW